MTTDTAENRPTHSIARIAIRAVVFAGLWWGLTEPTISTNLNGAWHTAPAA